jgi:RNA polymerase sigma-70 factor (ECF subfamily)
MNSYKSGDGSAFDELYNRYEKRLFAFLNRRIPGNEAMALDVFQLSWLKVHASRDKFDSKFKFSSWIYTIAMNSLRDELGEAWKRYGQELHENEAYSEAEIESPLAAAERGELREVIESALQMLSAPQREAIILSDLEGFSSKEIAQMMELSDGAVRQLIFRGRKELLVLFDKQGLKSA